MLLWGATAPVQGNLMEEKPNPAPAIQADERPQPVPQADPAVLPPLANDWVHEVKQWCLTGSRQAVPSGSLPLLLASKPGTPVDRTSAHEKGG